MRTRLRWGAERNGGAVCDARKCGATAVCCCCSTRQCTPHAFCFSPSRKQKCVSSISKIRVDTLEDTLLWSGQDTANVIVMGHGSAQYLFLRLRACSTAGRTGVHLASRVGRAYIPKTMSDLDRRCAHCLRLRLHSARRRGRGGTDRRVGRPSLWSSLIVLRT